MNCLLSFSGGLDSVAAAIVLKEKGYDVALGHIRWLIGGTNWGNRQTHAAVALAKQLDLPIKILAVMWFPQDSFAKYSWVPVCISTIMHHAGDPCEYPAMKVRRYDSVAFGTDFDEHLPDSTAIKRYWLVGMHHYAYDGPVAYPLDGLDRAERAALLTPELLAMTVSCYLGPDGEPCGTCYKCVP